MFSLDGRRALVTGASSGIGRAMAGALAEAGADVVLVARTEAALDLAATEIGGPATWVAADVGDPDQIERLCDEAGEVDVLVPRSCSASAWHPGWSRGAGVASCTWARSSRGGRSGTAAATGSPRRGCSAFSAT